MPKTIIYTYPDVYEYVRKTVPINYSPAGAGIGLVQDGELIAGVIYDDWNQQNIWMHVAAEPGRRWMTREYLHQCFAYPFLQLGCRRVSGWVDASNWEARRFDEHLGFKQEAVLKHAAKDGGDAIIYAMFREDCRFIKDHKNV